MDIFDKKHTAPMLIGVSSSAFDDEQYIYELKWDGTRCLAYLDPKQGMALHNKRFKVLTAMFPELAGLHKQVKKRCILDGELFVYNGGKVDFFEMQRRSLMSNPFKIQLAAEKLPVSFVAFDILYYDTEPVMDKPLMKRKELLQKVVKENDRIAVARYIEREGTALYKLSVQQELEGIVAKRKDSLYYPGKRTKDWIKCKNLQDDDFIVCGYYFKADNLISVILGSYKGEAIVYQGHVVMGVSREDFQQFKKATATTKEKYYPAFEDFEDATWFRPELVCKVEYMERTHGGGLRQPVYRGLRDDKEPEDCKLG